MIRITKKSHPKLYEAMRLVALNGSGIGYKLARVVNVPDGYRERLDDMEFALSRLGEKELVDFCEGDYVINKHLWYRSKFLDQANQFLNDFYENWRLGIK